MEGVVESVKARLQATAYKLVSRVVAYVCLVVALVFVFAGAFIWIANEESLVAACLVFAAAFFIIALIALIVMTIFGNRIRRYQESGPSFGTLVLRNPAAATIGFRLLGKMRRSPALILGAAVLAGLAATFLGSRKAEEG